jgi:hypothetical protein
VWSVPRLYNEDQLPLRQSLETIVRRVGSWCEMAASLRGREPGSRGTSTVGSRYQAAHWRPWLRTLMSVWQWSVQCSHELCLKMSDKSDYQFKPRLSSHWITWQYQIAVNVYLQSRLTLHTRRMCAVGFMQARQEHTDEVKILASAESRAWIFHYPARGLVTILTELPSIISSHSKGVWPAYVEQHTWTSVSASPGPGRGNS